MGISFTNMLTQVCYVSGIQTAVLCCTRVQVDFKLLDAVDKIMSGYVWDG